jgi:hypothetical protein
MKKLISAGLLFALVSSANAATVSVSAGFGGTSGLIVQDRLGNAIGAQSWFAVGAFASDPVIGDFASLVSTIGSMSIFSDGLTQSASPFKIAASFTNISNAALFNNKTMYFALGNGTTRANSTEFALFTMTSGTTTFPADITQPGGPNLTMANVTSVTVLPNAGTEIDTAGPDAIRLVGIPEPSSVILGAIGALGLLRRRRN